MEENNNLTQLHTALVNKGAVTGSVDDFKTYLSDDKNRNDLFEALKKKGAVTGSFNDFTSWLGMGENTTAASQPTATKYQLPTFQPYQRELDDSPASILSPTQLKIARGEIGEGDTFTLQPGEDIEAFTPLPNFTIEQTEEEKQQRQQQPKPQRQTMRDGSRMLGHNAALTRLAQDNGIATEGFENLNELGEDAMKIYALTPQGKADKQNMDNAAELAYDDFADDYLKNGSDQDIKAQLELGRQKQLLEQENAALAKDIEAWKAHPGTEQQRNALNARIRDLNKRIGAYEAAVAQSDKAQEKVNEAFQKWLENDDYYKAVAQQYEQNYEATMGDWFDSAATPLYMQMTKDEIAKMKAYLDDESLNLDHRQRTAIKRRVKDAEAWVKAAEKNGWLDKVIKGQKYQGAYSNLDIATIFRGMGNAIDFDLLDFGIGEAIDDATLRRIREKVRDKGEASLTPEERAVLLSDEALGLTKSVFNIDKSAWNAGANTAEMLPFIVELLLSGGANAAIKAGVKGAVKGGAKGFRQGLKAGWKAAMKPTASQLGRLGEAGRFAPKSIGQVAGEAGMTAAEIADNGLFYALTTGSGHTISQLNQYMTPEVDADFDFGTGKWDIKGIAVDENGNIKGGDKFGIAALKAIGMQAIEGGSEMLGEKALQPLLDRGGYWLRGMMGRQGRAMYKPYLRVVDDWIGHGALKNVSGFGIEYAEELAGSVARVITGLSTWDQEFNKQNLADTAYGLMPAQVAFAIIGGGRMVGHARRSSQAKDLLDKYAPEQAAFYDRVAQMSTYDGADMLDRKTLEILKTIDEKKNNGTLTDEDQRKAAAELGMIFTMQEQIYMDEASAYMRSGYRKRMYEGVTSNLNENNGKFVVARMKEEGGDSYVPVLSTKDGKAVVRLRDGKKKAVDVKDLEIVSEQTPEEALQWVIDRNFLTGYNYDDQTTPMAGSVYYDAEGNIPIVPGKGEVNITEVADNGDVTFTTDDGTTQTMNERKFYDYMRALRDAYEVTAGQLAAWRVEADTKGKTAAENDDPQAHYGVGREARMARRALANAIGEERMAELERMDGEQLTREYMMADEKTQDLMYDWMQNRVGDSYGETMNQRRQQVMTEWKQRIVRLPYDNGNVTTAVHNGNIVIVEDNDGQQAAIVDMQGNKSMVQSSELSNMQDNSLDSVAAQATMPQQAQLTALEQAYNGTTFQAGQEYTIGTDTNGEEKKAIIVSVNEDGTISYATEYGYDKEGNPTPAARSVKVATAEGFRDMTENARQQRATQEQGQREAAQQRADMGELRNGQRVTIMDGGHPVQGTVNMPYTGQVQIFTDTQKLIKFDTIDDLKKSMQDAANALQAEQQAAIEAVANRINELANAMPNARIKVVTDINELRPDAQEFAKQDKLEAYFDPDTNMVVFYAPGLLANNSNVDAKFVHEVVIHYGLKNMLGAKKYTELCINVYNTVMDDDAKKKYVDYVKQSHPNATLTDTELAAMAADEYLAFAYESKDIDALERKNILQRIVDAIMSLFKEAGVQLDRAAIEAELDSLVAASRDWLRGEEVKKEQKQEEKKEEKKEEQPKEEPQPEPTKTREELIANAVQAAANFAAQGDPNFVKDNLDKAKKRVSKAKERKPTSTDPAKRQEQIEKRNTELAAAENELAFWKDVQAVINEAQLAGQTRLNEADQALQELDGNLNPTVEAEEVHKFDKEPANADEAAADSLVGFVKKEYRINEESLARHTGWTLEEAKRFRPATTPDGGMSIEKAGEALYAEYEAEGHEHGWFSDPMDATSHLISVMQDAGSYGELANYINQRRGNDAATQQMQAALDYNAQQLGYADAQDMHDKRMAEAQAKLEELKDEQGNLSEEALQQFKDFTQGLMIGQEETPAGQPTESIEGEGEYYQPTNEEAPFSVRYSVVGNDREIYNGKSDQERSDIQYQKAQEVLKALNEAGYKDFYISRSITDFGVSTYIQGMYNLKFRISDHSVTSTHRILEEDFFHLDTPNSYFLDIVNRASELSKERARMFNERKEKERLLDEKWDRIKHLFAGLGFKRNERTYQNFDKFSSNDKRSNILQTPISGGAFRYEWTEPIDSYTRERPSYEWLEHYDEVEGGVQTPMFSVTGLITNEQGEIDYDRVTNLAENNEWQGLSRLPQAYRQSSVPATAATIISKAVPVEDRSGSEASRQRGNVQGVRQGDRGDNNQGQPDQRGNGTPLGNLADTIKSDIESWAKDQGYWYDEARLTDGFTEIEGGTESRVFVNADKTKARKLTSYPPAYGEYMQLLMENIGIFNATFPDAAYEVVGFGKDKNGNLAAVVEQPYIEGRQAKDRTEVVEAMRAFGFRPFYDEVTFTNGRVFASDVNEKNMVIDTDGEPHVIDAVMSLRSDLYNDSNVLYSVVTPQQDAAYMDAVSRGDMETAQRMVMEAAKAAMPNTKVVDENGNPLVVYHGTFIAKEYIDLDSGTRETIDDTPFTVFNTASDEQLGAHFGTERQAGNVAQRRSMETDWRGSEKVYAVYLNIKKPLNLADNFAWDFDHIGKQLLDKGYITKSEYTELAPTANRDEAMKELLISKGYDGVIYWNNGFEGYGRSYISFSPNQIKSADPVTYDDQGNVIPLSERFNPNNNDIRYSMVSPQQDAAYMQAVESGDMEAAQRMVDEAAREAGYISDNDFRMSHTAPNGRDGFSKSIATTEGIYPEDLYSTQGYRYYGDGDVSMDMESANIFKRLRGNPEALVKIYRAVPKSLKETKLRNGDWVTINRRYAQEHGENNIDGGYKIIEDEVPAKFVYTDGNSLHEQGYDDGNEYAYQNTKNNRKLLDAVTYDDEGNVIPLSKRFNKRSGDIRYSFIGRSGAQRLDMADRAMTRLNNLHVAREMEKQGKDAKAIKLATGWERGKDGKWRYEIMDFAIDKDSDFGKWIAKRAEARATHLRKAFRKADKLRQEALLLEPLEDMKLEDILEKDSEIFKAYPQLKDYKLKTYFEQSATGGWHDRKNKTINLNKALLNEDGIELSTLAHEIQHVIQNIEGFAVGGSPSGIAQAVKDMNNNAKIWSYKQMLDEVAKDSPEHADDAEALLKDILEGLGYDTEVYRVIDTDNGFEYVPKAEYEARQDGFIPEENLRKQAFKIYQGKIKGDTYEKAYKQWYNKMKEAETTTYYEGTPFELYKRLAGETEARNVQTRLGFTEEQRRQLLAAETEDVVREDQLVMFAGDPVLYSVSQAANTPQERLQLYDAMNGEKYASNFVGRVTEGFYRSVVDGAIPLKRLQDVIAGRGKVTDAENAYLMEIARAARAKRLTDEAETKYYEPMMKAIAALTGRTSKKGYYKAMRDVELYVLAKSGLERNQWFWDEAKKSDPNAQLEDKSGLTALAAEFGEKDFTGFAQRLVADYEARHGRQKIDELWKCINAVSKNILDTELDGHLISQELHDDLLNRWKFYVPMRGFDEQVTSAFYAYQPSSATIRFENPFKKIKGRVSLADNPFVNLIRMTESAINLKGKNEVGLALLNLAASHDDNGLLRVGKAWEVKEVDPATGEVTWKAAYPNLSNVSQADIPAAIDAFQKAMMRQAKTGDARPSSRTAGGVRIHPSDIDQHVLKVKVGGQTVDLYLLGNPKAFQALNPTGKSKAGEKLSGLTRTLSGFMTTYNPVFMVRNSIRDFKTAAIITYTRDGAAGMFNMMGQWFGNMNALRKLIAGKSSGDATLDRYWQEFLEFGGETGFTRSLNMEKRREDFNKKMFNLTRDKSGQVIHKLTHGYFDWMEKHGNRYAEDITRFAVFCASRKQGRSAMQAAADAKNTTANFNKKGQSGFARFMSTNFAFFNAAIQGLNTSFHAFKDNPGRAWTAAVSTMIYSMAIPFVNMCLLAMFGDDDDWRQYENMTQFVSNTHAVYYIPGAGFLTMPYPQDFVPFTSLGNIIWRNTAGFEKPLNGRSIFGNVMLQWFDTWADLLPVNAFEEGFGEMKDWKGVARALAPTWLSPVADVMLNRNFMGSQIRRKHFTLNDQKDLAPYWAEYDRSKNWWAHDIARLIAGGDEYRAGAAWRNVDPRQLIHLVEGYGGGTVKLMSDIAVYFEEMAKGDKPTLNQAPFIKKFWIQPNPDKYEGNLNGKLYEMAKYQRELEQQIKDLQKEADKAREDGNDKAAEKREKKIEEIQNSMEYKILIDYDVNGKMKKWREERNDITNDEKLSEEGKQDKIVTLTYQKAAFLDGIWEEAFVKSNDPEAPEYKGKKSNWFSEFYRDASTEAYTHNRKEQEQEEE